MNDKCRFRKRQRINCDGGKTYTRKRAFPSRKVQPALSVSWNFTIEIDWIVNLAIVNTHCTLLRRTCAESGLIFAEWRGRSGWNTSLMTCLNSTTIRDMNHARQACDVWIRAKYFEDSSARFRVSRNPSNNQGEGGGRREEDIVCVNEFANSTSTNSAVWIALLFIQTFLQTS